MSISKLVNWLDEVDPYHIQRLVFHKTMYVATLLVFAYWIFQPQNPTAYLSPIFVASVYEIPGKPKDREKRLLFMFGTLLLCITTFYLVYPHKFAFLLYSFSFMAILYFTILKYIPILKYAMILVIINAALVLPTKPFGNWQVMISIFSSSLLTMLVIFFALKLSTWNYTRIWRHALIKYIGCIEQQIKEAIFPVTQSAFFSAEIQHLNVMRSYRPLIPLNQLRDAIKISTAIKHIQFSLFNIDSNEQNTLFWLDIKRNLHRLSRALIQNKPCTHYDIAPPAETIMQEKITHYLNKAIRNWNKLCSKTLTR